ncbi:UNVERIFIED_CONTAM: 3-hydroxyacyl-CoA dehydrogenase NAD-binding domain-containing protein, partial [Prevotella sp. 15_C9]
MATAVEGVDLVIEAIPENIAVKKMFYAQLRQVADANTIFATNTSTLLPSELMEDTGRPEKFLALHFANQIWINNTAE